MQLNISTFIPYIIAVGVVITSLTVAIVVARATTINTTGLVLKVTSVALAISTLFFYTVIWLAITLLNPKENYLLTVFGWYFLTGILPALFIYHKGSSSYADDPKTLSSPKEKITIEEKTNE